MQQIARSVALAFNSLPRPHRIMLGSLTAMSLAVALWQPLEHHYSESKANDHVAEVDSQSLSQINIDASEPVDQTPPDPQEDLSADEKSQGLDDANTNREYIISSGDTLSSVLNQYGIALKDIRALVASDKELTGLNVGQNLSWTLDDNGDLATLNWTLSRRESRSYQRTVNGTFERTKQVQQGEWQDQVLTGRVQGSFSASAQRAGLSSAEASAVTRALQWQMDFRKLRSGDKFSVLLSREVLAGKTMQSQLLGVRLHSVGQDYFAFRAEDGKFYDKHGAGLARGFLRFPTARQYRVSSNFNPHRLNPVTGRIAPHRGVDFALPIGTPVLATGDGEIVVANRSGGAAGNYVAVRHGRQYMTRYMHLSRVLVKPGQKVKRGDRIALSGNTGRSTGPHLHYEVWINNQAVNPLTAKMPKMEGLSGNARKRYLAQVNQWKAKLAF